MNHHQVLGLYNSLVTLHIQRGVTISLQTGRQGRPAPIHTQTSNPTHKHSQTVSLLLVFPLFDSITIDRQSDGPTVGWQPTNGWTKPLVELRIRN